jgi:hypothetical protein
MNGEKIDVEKIHELIDALAQAVTAITEALEALKASVDSLGDTSGAA